MGIRDILGSKKDDDAKVRALLFNLERNAAHLDNRLSRLKHILVTREKYIPNESVKKFDSVNSSSLELLEDAIEWNSERKPLRQELRRLLESIGLIK